MKTLSGGKVLGGAVAVALALLGACNGSSTAPAPAPEAGPVCPATTADTIGAACTFPGLICSPTYVCGFTDVTLLCTCKNGAFVCTDSAGDPLSGPPMCPAAVPPEACPATERAALSAACTDTGLLCNYRSVCPGLYDQCQCASGSFGDGGFGFSFVCTSPSCPPSDAGATVFDAGSDATADTGAADAHSPVADAPGDVPLEAALDSSALDQASPADAPSEVETVVDDAPTE